MFFYYNYLPYILVTQQKPNCTLQALPDVLGTFIYYK